MSTPATVSVSDVMVAIADQLTAELSPVVEGIQIDPKQVRTPTPPCIDIYPGDPFLVPTSFGLTGAEAIYTVRARVTTADQQDGQELLLRFMDPATPESIWAALITDPTFGSTVDHSTVETVSGFIPYDVTGPGGGYSGSLLAAEWRVKVEL